MTLSPSLLPCYVFLCWRGESCLGRRRSGEKEPGLYAIECTVRLDAWHAVDTNKMTTAEWTDALLYVLLLLLYPPFRLLCLSSIGMSAGAIDASLAQARISYLDGTVVDASCFLVCGRHQPDNTLRYAIAASVTRWDPLAADIRKGPWVSRSSGSNLVIRSRVRLWPDPKFLSQAYL